MQGGFYDNGYNTDVEEDDLHNKEKRKKLYGVKKRELISPAAWVSVVAMVGP